MPAVKLSAFIGRTPKTAEELLPSTAAQIARNCKLYSGDLIPYPQPVIVGNTDRTGTVSTLFGLRDPDTDARKWLSWDSDVDIVVASESFDSEQRFYYTGSGAPKVSNYALAVNGAGPYPTGYYDLGLPIPDDSATPVASMPDFTQKTSASYARNADGIVTMTTTAAHGLRSGAYVAVSRFEYISGTYVQASSSRTGTYVQSSGTTSLTVMLPGHNLTGNTVVKLEFSADSHLNGAYNAVVVDTDSFAITAPSASRYGNITWLSAGTTTITCTLPGHPFVTGSKLQLDFVTGTAVDGTYEITNVTTNTFDVIARATGATGGEVRVSLSSLNTTGAECTVIDDTTFSYYAPGPELTSTASTAGKVDLGGLTQARTYVFTWVTPWGEESIGCKPTTEKFVKEGVTATLTGLPTAAPAGDNFIRGVNIYRSVSSTAGTDYFLLNTLWFPTSVKYVARASDVATVELEHPHNFGIGDVFKISGCSLATFDVTGGVVASIPDDYTFTYAQVGSDVARTATASGTLYHDVSENPPDTAARYWGDASYAFVDDFDSRGLTTVLATDNYDAPPEGLQGLTQLNNNILVGFVDNTIYFSEPNVPHAWPAEYAIPIEYDVVAIAPIAGYAVVLTTGHPYIVSTSDPANGVSVARADAYYPCLSKRSVVGMGFGIVYATHDGLAVYSPTTGAQLLTKDMYEKGTWYADLDPTTIVAQYYNGGYFAAHSTGSFVYQRNQDNVGSLVDTEYTFTAAWYDPISGSMFYSYGGNGDVYEWDNALQAASTQEWKSKVFTTPGMVNLGAARVIADYTEVSPTWDAATITWESETRLWNAGDEITFKLWADKSLVYTTTVNDPGVIRLPTGYLSDTFEVGVSGDVRVRAIHLAETPMGLKEA